MKRVLNLMLPIFAICLVSCCKKGVNADYNIVPAINKIELKSDKSPFTLNKNTVIYYTAQNEDMKRNASLLAGYIKDITGYELKTVEGEGDGKGIELSISDDVTNSEGYKIEVDDDSIEIEGSTPAGVFYGIQTIRKSIPADAGKNASIKFPEAKINDAPRFSYRGMMLDPARHMIEVDSIKRFIDIMALHNQNRLHIHLNDDQGWRIEIKKYPRLTEIGSKRVETTIGKNSGNFDGKPHEGFYTREEMIDIIKYAGDRYITVIPEIDLPGHQVAALASYPQFGCTGGPYEVAKEWGVMDDVICAGNEEAMIFLEDVLSEIAEIFPSDYIHVGGDECPKKRWAKCPKCQARIKALGIKADKTHKAEEYLQSYVISRMEKHLESKGRSIIGWDEILEGGLAPNATVMSWRGTTGGIEAARQGHKVIMSPTTYLYFDYYQSEDITNEPVAGGNCLPLHKVYSYEPIEAELTEEEAKLIIGVQANMWGEHLYHFTNVEYMAMPRIAALCEIQWSNKEHKNYDSFLNRVPSLLKFYDMYGYKYGRQIYEIQSSIKADYANKDVVVELNAIGGDIRYSVDGTTPTLTSELYTAPLRINTPTQLRTAIFRPDGTMSNVFGEDITFNKATMKPITVNSECSEWARFGPDETLNNGLKGNRVVASGRWLGYKDQGFEAIIDLEEPTTVEKVVYGVLVDRAEWAMSPVLATVSVSDDGKNFKEVARVTAPELKAEDPIRVDRNEIAFPQTSARYVKVYVTAGNMPKWHQGYGEAADLLIDEVEIY